MDQVIEMVAHIYRVNTGGFWRDKEHHALYLYLKKAYTEEVEYQNGN